MMILPTRTGVQRWSQSLGLRTPKQQLSAFKKDVPEPTPEPTPSQQAEGPGLLRAVGPLPHKGLLWSGRCRCPIPSRGGCQELLLLLLPSRRSPAVHCQDEGLARLKLLTAPRLPPSVLRVILTSSMWCSLREWRAHEAHQCQGLKKACLCQGASYDGGQAPALPSSTPSTGPVLVNAQSPRQHPAAASDSSPQPLPAAAASVGSG